MLKTKKAQKETIAYLLNEIRRHRHMELTTSTQISSPHISRALGEMMAQDLIEPFVWFGVVAFRLTKLGYSQARDLPIEEVGIDAHGFAYHWRD